MSLLLRGFAIPRQLDRSLQTRGSGLIISTLAHQHISTLARLVIHIYAAQLIAPGLKIPGQLV